MIPVGREFESHWVQCRENGKIRLSAICFMSIVHDGSLPSLSLIVLSSVYRGYNSVISTCNESRAVSQGAVWMRPKARAEAALRAV